MANTLADPVTGYCAVYGIEILLLLAAIIAIGPLSRRTVHTAAQDDDLRGATSLGFNPGGMP